MLSYKYRLKPSEEQIVILKEQINICRRMYNYLLDYSYEKRKNVNKTPTMYDLVYLIPPLKKDYPELKQIYAQALENVAERVHSGFVNFWARRMHKLKAGLPRFRREDDYNSITYRVCGYKIDKNTLTLSKIGVIPIILHRPIIGKIKRVTVLRDGEKWYVCFACEIENILISNREKMVGIDVGLISLIATDTGELIDTPKCYRKAERRLKRLQRQLSKKKFKSKNWYKSKARLTKLHKHVANQRKDVTGVISRNLVNRYEHIILEDLKVSNMIKNHHLAKSIGDAGWAELKRNIQYKAEMSGGSVILVDPKGTSQTCPECGGRVQKTLAERTHNCPHCGLVLPRDVASAREIKKRGQITLLKRDRLAHSQIYACGDDGNADSEQSEQRPASVNQESFNNKREGLYIVPSDISTFTDTITTGDLKSPQIPSEV